MYCSQCGAENPASSRFCGQCGTALAVESTPTVGAEPLSVGPPTESFDGFGPPGADVGAVPDPSPTEMVPTVDANATVVIPAVDATSGPEGMSGTGDSGHDPGTATPTWAQSSESQPGIAPGYVPEPTTVQPVATPGYPPPPQAQYSAPPPYADSPTYGGQAPTQMHGVIQSPGAYPTPGAAVVVPPPGISSVAGAGVPRGSRNLLGNVFILICAWVIVSELAFIAWTSQSGHNRLIGEAFADLAPHGISFTAAKEAIGELARGDLGYRPASTVGMLALTLVPILALVGLIGGLMRSTGLARMAGVLMSVMMAVGATTLTYTIFDEGGLDYYSGVDALRYVYVPLAAAFGAALIGFVVSLGQRQD